MLACFTFAQHISLDIEEVEVTPPQFTNVENVAEIINGETTDLIDQFLLDNFQYPENCCWKLGGTEIVRFVVTPTGELTGFTIVNSVSPSVDEEFIRILKLTNGKWKPGFSNGNPVAMEKEVAMQVKVSETGNSALRKDFVDIATACFKKANSRFLHKGKPRKALRLYNMGIRHYPYDESLYLMRGICKYELGDIEGARMDWERLLSLGGIEMESKYIVEQVKDKKGFGELSNLVQKAKE